MKKRTGYQAVRWLRHRTLDQKGGNTIPADGLDRSEGTLTHHVESYLEHLHVRNYTPLGVRSRWNDLKPFLLWAQERDLFRPEQITRSILESYQRYNWRYRKKDGKPLGTSTQSKRLVGLKMYFKWLCRQRVLEANPASEIELPRTEKRLPTEALTIHEIQQVIGLPNITDPMGLRDRAILELLYSTGVRRSELRNLDLADLNRSRRTLRVRQGKGRKDRIVPVGKRALKWVERYIDDVRPLLIVQSSETGLFLSAYGTKFNAEALGRKICRYIKDADLGRTGGAHLIRHTCATHLLEGGADIRYIQQLLGHAKLETTAIYTEVSITQLQAIHDQCHPAENRP